MVNEIHDILGYPTFQPTNNTRTGVGINGFIDDMIVVMHLDDMKTLFNKKMENNEHYMALVTLIQTPEFMVSIHCVYLSYISCCFWYVHISVPIVVMTALLLPTDVYGHYANLARMAGTVGEST